MALRFRREVQEKPQPFAVLSSVGEEQVVVGVDHRVLSQESVLVKP